MIASPRMTSTVTRIAWFATYAMCALILISVLLAVLPSRWVGTPYLSLAERLNPGIDAPDNWGMAFTYFARIVSGLAIGVIAAAVVAVRCGRGPQANEVPKWR
jgi:hypothetical protein